ncbi:MAG TPA: AAA family ATPase [Polyangium sp.]|nr:AAA family ATPase [Polyangium sp.]
MFVLPGYSFRERVFQGVTASLYRGARNGDGQVVLVKALVEEYPSPRSIAQLRHECAIERELGLDGIVRPLELVDSGNGLVLVWADPGGVPLTNVLASGALEVVNALRIARMIASTLESVHGRGVIHKNVTPENILVDIATMRTHLSGFGIATRLTHEIPPLTSPSTLDASLDYMSPEQTGRMNRIVDRRSDLYSLGIVLYEMLTGCKPFSSTDVMDGLYRHLVEKPVPPHERIPSLPRMVSDLVMKLLEKSAEDRYQSASGLGEDLRICSEWLETQGSIPAFSFHYQDHGGALHMPQKLYGRSEELRALESAWERARAGKPELLLVRGYSGIGKSVLVHEIHKELTGARGYFITGKCEQLDRSTPHACFAQAFRDLVQQLLMESEETFARSKARIQAAVGANGQVLIDMVPELERLLGPQPSVPVLTGMAARHRFTRVLLSFVEVFTAHEHPLVVFLDDLQWADLASLDLLTALLKENESGRLLVLGAYRTNEVDDSHPLTAALKTMSGTMNVKAVELGPLDARDVGQFIADALGSTREGCADLTDVIYEKTRGNPFFVIQMLTALHKEGLLRYEANAAAYCWDIEAVRALTVTDNVVPFMIERLGRLPPRTQRVLCLAACIGHRFDLQTLSVIGEAAPRTIASDLWDALSGGMVVPLSPHYQVFHDEIHERPEELFPAAEVSYRFLHDRVQQAAYEGIRDDERAALHLKIGRLMLVDQMERGPSDRLYQLVSHLNLGRDLITDRTERECVARLNLEAGKRAKAATAYEAASRTLKAGISLLDSTITAETHDLTFALHFEFVECTRHAGSANETEAEISFLEKHAQTSMERARVLDVRMVFLAARGQPKEAVRVGEEALRVLGFDVPESEEASKIAYERELHMVGRELAERSTDEFVASRVMTSEVERLALRIARHLALSAFGVKPNLGYWLTAFAVTLSITHGNSDDSAAAYALLGAVLASSTTRFAEAHKLGQIALGLHEKSGTVHETCLLGFYFVTISHYSMHWRALLPYLNRAYVAGLESGDLMFLSYTCSHQVIARFILGDPLADVRVENERLLALMQKKNLASAAATQTVVRQTIACLEGRTRGPRTFDNDGFEESEFTKSIETAKMSFAIAWFYTVKGIVLFLDDDPEGALASLERALKSTPIAFTPEARYYLCLAILALEGHESVDERERREVILSRSMRDLETWANACPANYLHKHLLVQAEQARRTGDGERAMDLYDRALAAAREYDWPRDIALASELCAVFYLGRGRIRIARAYMTDACYAYARWGASIRLRRLTEKYPALVPAEMQTDLVHEDAVSTTVSVDMLAFVQGLQTISREILLEKVVEQVMRIVLQDAGAERGVLLLSRQDKLIVHALCTTTTTHVAVAPDEPLTERAEYANSIVRYVARTGELIVLDDAQHDARFGRDEHVVRGRVRSIACLSLMHQGRLKAVLYLENNAATAAFTASRIERLGLLASQAAISIDNAELYARVQTTTEQLSHANAALQEAVAQQTAELRAANEHLEHELVERRRAEDARAQMHEEIIELQNTMLTDLMTPMLQILKGILVLPLIGRVNEARATEVLEVAIRGATERGAKVVILDVTGVGHVDAAMDTLLGKLARALRLVGVELFVTGIRSAMAAELARTATEVGKLKTYATLDGGVLAALQGLGRNRGLASSSGFSR